MINLNVHDNEPLWLQITAAIALPADRPATVRPIGTVPLRRVTRKRRLATISPRPLR
jgi:hypothetical protein